MKKQLTFALLSISIFSLNILPAKSAETVKTVETVEIDTVESTEESSDLSIAADGTWCVYVPGLNLICLPL